MIRNLSPDVWAAEVSDAIRLAVMAEKSRQGRNKVSLDVCLLFVNKRVCCMCLYPDDYANSINRTFKLPLISEIKSHAPACSFLSL